ncbi:MAG: Gfo/Idh/MocA family oxidoreductase [Planctomycetota bacterium]
MKTVEAVLVGSGCRGFEVVGKFARRFPHKLKIVAVAEPIDWRRETFADDFGIEPERRFKEWGELAEKPQLAEVLFNMTGDIQHVPITREALRKGYHVLLEKPIADTPEGCLELADVADETDRILQLGLCLRFTPFYQTAAEILHSGRIGQVITVDYQESISCTHMAHSFVRGNWSNRKAASPMIISKSCHDLDMLIWLLGSECKKVSSFGSLKYFNSKNAPDGAPKRCTDGCPHEHMCPFSAIKLYVKNVSGVELGFGSAGWYVCPSNDPQERMEALKTSPYGRCVYHCDNDVVDHQVVTMEFEDGQTVAFTMQGFATPSGGDSLWGPNQTNAGRRFTFWGTDGVLRAPTYGHLELTDHSIGHTEKMQTGFPEGSHGGGDFSMIHNFLDAVQQGSNAQAVASVKECVHGHLIGFAAEHSRLTGRTVDIDEWSSSLLTSNR